MYVKILSNAIKNSQTAVDLLSWNFLISTPNEPKIPTKKTHLLEQYENKTSVHPRS